MSHIRPVLAISISDPSWPFPYSLPWPRLGSRTWTRTLDPGLGLGPWIPDLALEPWIPDLALEPWIWPWNPGSWSRTPDSGICRLLI